MFVVGFEFDIKGIAAETDSQRALERVMKQVMYDILLFWHEVLLKMHFRRGADAQYDYAPRTEATKAMKWNAFKAGKAISPDRSLIRGGELQERMKSHVLIRAYPTRAIATMHGPHYVGMRPARAGLPNMGREITYVADEEVTEIATLAAERAAELLRANRTRRRRTIR